MKISMYAAISVDGFLARSDGSIDWLDAIGGEGEDFGYGAFYSTVDAIVMGGKTYRTLVNAGDWGYAGKCTWVYSRKALNSGRDDVFQTNMPAPAFVEHLRSKGKQHLWVMGGGEIHSLFLREGLIDEMRLFIIPLALGEGIPLFAPPIPDMRWSLQRTKPWHGNILEMVYTHTGAPTPK
ncbi:MAG: dihydrofolate reductase family protein [Puniceicoccales bacterium]|jgi:dihydrofolate reductase|nr:dihydrofolate reductase family protein [Puniceicoccales bacterium]